MGDVHDYGAGGKCEYLKDIWDRPTITGGTVQQRLAKNDYCKESHAARSKEGLLDALMESADTRGPPFTNESRPKRIL